MNNAAREIKQKINEARETFLYVLGDNLNDKDCIINVKIEPNQYKSNYVYARLKVKHVKSGGGMSMTRCEMPSSLIEECDVLQLSQLFTTEAGRQHLSRYLIGKEACLVKD